MWSTHMLCSSTPQTPRVFKRIKMIKAWHVVSKDDGNFLTHNDGDLPYEGSADTVIEEGFFITKKEHEEQLREDGIKDEALFEYRAIIDALQEERNKIIKSTSVSGEEYINDKYPANGEEERHYARAVARKAIQWCESKLQKGE